MNLDYYNCLEEYIRRILDELEQKDKEIQELKKYDIRNIGLKEDKIIRSPRFTREELDFINIGIGLKSRETRELKEKYNKDTYILQNQLYLANADRVEKDKIIKLIAKYINSTDIDEDICRVVSNRFFDCPLYENEDEEVCINCIIDFFKKEARKENE